MTSALFKKAVSIMMAVACITLFLPAQNAWAQTPEVGKTYYTQYNFKIEKGKFKTTNYWRGELIPLNSKVEVLSIGDNKMVLDLDGRSITVVNIEKRTLRGINKIAEEMLSPNKVPLNKFSAERRDEIEVGNLRLGMTKDEVIMTRGYPPRHKTASTKSNTWVYWSSRFVQRTLVFHKGRLTEGRGIR